MEREEREQGTDYLPLTSTSRGDGKKGEKIDIHSFVRSSAKRMVDSPDGGKGRKADSPMRKEREKRLADSPDGGKERKELTD